MNREFNRKEITRFCITNVNIAYLIIIALLAILVIVHKTQAVDNSNVSELGVREVSNSDIVDDSPIKGIDKVYQKRDGKIVTLDNYIEFNTLGSVPRNTNEVIDRIGGDSNIFIPDNINVLSLEHKNITCEDNTVIVDMVLKNELPVSIETIGFYIVLHTKDNEIIADKKFRMKDVNIDGYGKYEMSIAFTPDRSVDKDNLDISLVGKYVR